MPSFIIRHDDPAPEQTTTYQVLSDHLGSVRVVAGIDGVSPAIAEEIEYDEFGLDNGPSGFQPFGFAGGHADSGGHVRFGARDYDPISGRWIGRDAALFEGGCGNLYEYALSDSINLVDHTGEAPEVGGDDPFFGDDEEIRKLEKKAASLPPPGKERSKLLRRIKELRRTKSKRAQHHYVDLCIEQPALCAGLTTQLVTTYALYKAAFDINSLQINLSLRFQLSALSGGF